MKLLLDTHALLWFAQGDPKLGVTARTLIADRRNDCYVSVVAAWEIAVKVSLGKLNVATPVDRFIDEAVQRLGAVVLPVELRHVYEVARLPFHHRDPFDRLLVAQAIDEGLPLVSADQTLDAYGIDRRW